MLPPAPDDVTTLPAYMPMPWNNLFLYDSAAGTTSLASVSPDAELSGGNVSTYSFSPDGKQIAFTTSATDLTHNPPAPTADLSSIRFLFRRASSGPTTSSSATSPQATSLVSVAPVGRLSNDPTFGDPPTAFFGPDGQSLFFTSSGLPLVTIDGNNASDLYAASAPFVTPDEIHFSTWQYGVGQAAGTSKIRVVRNAPHDGPASVKYTVVDGTARAGDDFSPSPGRCIWSRVVDRDVRDPPEPCTVLRHHEDRYARPFRSHRHRPWATRRPC